MKKTVNSVTKGVLAAGGVALMLPFAQMASAERVLEEVIVTATKREQAVNDIPVAVSAYGGEDLRQSGVRDVGQIVQVNPSVSFGTTESSSSGTLSIRGMGTLGTDPGLESSVGVFIDGVYRNRSGVAIDELGEIERIEVLRGPQGTLFGRNTSAGLLNVVTKGPNFEENEGFVELQLGNYNLRRLAAGASGPIKDDLAGRIDVVGTQRDGVLEEQNGGPDLNDRDRYMVRGQLAWDADEDVSVRVIADYSDRKEYCCGSPSSEISGAANAIVAMDATNSMANNSDRGLDDDEDPYDREIFSTTGRDKIDETDSWGVSAEVNWNVNDTTQFVSITAYRDWHTYIGGDLDWSGADLFYYPRGQAQERNFLTATQELRLQGSWEHGSWLVGVFYADETFNGKFNATYGADLNTYTAFVLEGFSSGAAAQYQSGALTGNDFFVPGQGVTDEGEQGSESIAVFTQNDFDLSERLLLTVGLRYTREEKDMTLDTTNTYQFAPGAAAGGNPCLGIVTTLGANHPFVPVICGISALTNPFLNNGGLGTVEYKADRADEEVTGTVKLAYTLEDDSLLWANVARGFKGGGFNQSRLGLNASTATANGDQLAFDRELTDTIEIGYKTYLAGRTVALNATLFYSEFSDFQLGQFNGATLITTSVDKVETQGAEVEFTWQALDNLRIAGGVTYNDNFYPDDSDIDTLSGSPQGTRAGKRRGQDWTATASMMYTTPLSEKLIGSAYLDARYAGDGNTNSSLASQFDRSDFAIVNGRVGISDPGRNWLLELWAKNLLDQDASPIQYNPPPIQGTVTGGGRIADWVNEPRTFGVTGRKYF